MGKKIHSCMTKAITTTSFKFVGFSLKWAFSRRGRLMLFDDHLECGNWHISYSDIKRAALKKKWGLLVPGYLLMIETPSKIYHFGLNRSSFWKGELPFPVTRTS